MKSLAVPTCGHWKNKRVSFTLTGQLNIIFRGWVFLFGIWVSNKPVSQQTNLSVLYSLSCSLPFHYNHFLNSLTLAGFLFIHTLRSQNKYSDRLLRLKPHMSAISRCKMVTTFITIFTALACLIQQCHAMSQIHLWKKKLAYQFKQSGFFLFNKL